MIYCYFNEDYENTYNCEYVINENELLIDVDLGNATSDLMDELFDEKDNIVYANTITIIDQKSKTYIKTFTAFEYHFQTITGYPYIRAKKSFRSKSYFKTNIESNLTKLSPNILIDNLIFAHESLDNYYPNKSRHIEHSEDLTETRIILKKNEEINEKLSINKNNIKLIEFENNWSYNIGHKDISIEYKNALKLHFKNKINLMEIYKYKDYISCMFNLYLATKTPIYSTSFKYENVVYEFYCTNLIYKPNFKTNINKKLNCDIQIFIKSFLKQISIKQLNTNLLNPFNGKGDVYAEDVFLINFRFIELHLKKENPKTWLQMLIKENKPLLNLLKIKYDSKLYLCVETLRNHYVHEGYYINKNTLEIKYCNGKKKRFTNEIIIKYSRLTKALGFKVMLNDILSLNIPDGNIASLI